MARSRPVSRGRRVGTSHKERRWAWACSCCFLKGSAAMVWTRGSAMPQATTAPTMSVAVSRCASAPARSAIAATVTNPAGGDEFGVNLHLFLGTRPEPNTSIERRDVNTADGASNVVVFDDLDAGPYVLLLTWDNVAGGTSRPPVSVVVPHCGAGSSEGEPVGRDVAGDQMSQESSRARGTRGLRVSPSRQPSRFTTGQLGRAGDCGCRRASPSSPTSGSEPGFHRHAPSTTP